MNKVITNESISEHLKEIARIYGIRKETQRAIAFNRAAEAVANFKDSVAVLEDLQSIPNVGGSSAAVIREFIDTGTSSRYQEIQKDLPAVELTLDLESFTSNGVSALAALGLWKHHRIANFDQLKKALIDGKIDDPVLRAKLKL